MTTPALSRTVALLPSYTPADLGPVSLGDLVTLSFSDDLVEEGQDRNVFLGAVEVR